MKESFQDWWKYLVPVVSESCGFILSGMKSTIAEHHFTSALQRDISIWVTAKSLLLFGIQRQSGFPKTSAYLHPGSSDFFLWKWIKKQIVHIQPKKENEKYYLQVSCPLLVLLLVERRGPSVFRVIQNCLGFFVNWSSSLVLKVQAGVGTGGITLISQEVHRGCWRWFPDSSQEERIHSKISTDEASGAGLNSDSNL